MTLDPSTPDEEPKETGLVTRQALEERLGLFERALRNRLELVTKPMVDTWIKEALTSFKSTLEGERCRREQEQAHEKHQLWMQRNERYMGIMIGAVIGFIATMILVALAQHLH
jgi:tetrahydromethanopterin S-methyltransferase subunit G